MVLHYSFLPLNIKHQQKQVIYSPWVPGNDPSIGAGFPPFPGKPQTRKVLRRESNQAKPGGEGSGGGPSRLALHAQSRMSKQGQPKGVL